MPFSRTLPALALVLCTVHAHARIGLVVGEPFGNFGTMMPSGHAGIYLDHLCAATPTRLRLCRPGEYGVVLSRYHDLRQMDLDWMAVPAPIFFYGVEDPAAAPTFMTLPLEAELREQYRAAHLAAIAPLRLARHGDQRAPIGDDWQEAIGAAFDRRLLVYTLDTTPVQDNAILAAVNALPLRRRYALGHANCADFAADLMALVLPRHPTRNPVGDLGMTSPKNLARQLDALHSTRPDLRVFEVPQIPGTLRRSRPMRGAAETLLKTKRYLVTLLILQPELVLADWILYEKKGRWQPGLDAIPETPEALLLPVPPNLAFAKDIRPQPQH